MPERTAQPDDSPKRGIGAVEVGLRLLDALAAAGGPMQLKDLAAAAGMPPAKAHRYLASFVAGGMVAQAGRSGRYDLGPLALRVGVAALKRFDAVERACARLAGLRDDVRATCFVTAWSDRGPVIVRWEDSLRPVTVIVELGSAMPLLRSATGRVWLAFLPPERASSLLAAELAETGRTAADADALAAAARADGLGRVEGEFQEGIAALAAPLFDPRGEMVGAVTALGRAGEFDASVDGDVAARLRAFAEDAGA